MSLERDSFDSNDFVTLVFHKDEVRAFEDDKDYDLSEKEIRARKGDLLSELSVIIGETDKYTDEPQSIEKEYFAYADKFNPALLIIEDDRADEVIWWYRPKNSDNFKLTLEIELQDHFATIEHERNFLD